MNLFLISILLLPSSTLSLSLANKLHTPQLDTTEQSIESLDSTSYSSSYSKTVTTRLPSTARQLKGRFLHLTDLHPDPHYKYGTDIDIGVCHRKIKSIEEVNVLGSKNVMKGKGKAGYWGEPDR